MAARSTYASWCSDTFPTRVLLYHLDKRMPNNNSPRVEMKTSDLFRVHEYVCQFFAIEEEWSKRLIERLLEEDVLMFSCFELGRRDRDDLGHGIRLIGNTDDLWICDSDIRY